MTAEAFSPHRPEPHSHETLHLVEIQNPLERKENEDDAALLAAGIAKKDGVTPILVRFIHADDHISYHLHESSSTGKTTLLHLENTAQESPPALDALDFFETDRIEISADKNADIYNIVHGYPLHLMEIKEPAESKDDDETLLAAGIAEKGGLIPTLVKFTHADKCVSYHVYGLSKKGVPNFLCLEGITQKGLHALDRLDFQAGQIETSPYKNVAIYEAIVSSPTRETLITQPHETDAEYEKRLENLAGQAKNHHAFLHALMARHTKPFIAACQSPKHPRRNELIYNSLLKLGEELNNYFKTKTIDSVEATYLAEPIGAHPLFHDFINSLSSFMGIIKIAYQIAHSHKMDVGDVAGERYAREGEFKETNSIASTGFFHLATSFLAHFTKPATDQAQVDRFKSSIADQMTQSFSTPDDHSPEALSPEQMKDLFIQQSHSLLELLEKAQEPDEKTHARIAQAFIIFTHTLFHHKIFWDDISSLIYDGEAQGVIKRLKAHQAILGDLRLAYEMYCTDARAARKRIPEEFLNHINVIERLIETPEWHDNFAEHFKLMLANKANAHGKARRELSGLNLMEVEQPEQRSAPDSPLPPTPNTPRTPDEELPLVPQLSSYQRARYTLSMTGRKLWYGLGIVGKFIFSPSRLIRQYGWKNSVEEKITKTLHILFWTGLTTYLPTVIGRFITIPSLGFLSFIPDIALTIASTAQISQLGIFAGGVAFIFTVGTQFLYPWVKGCLCSPNQDPSKMPYISRFETPSATKTRTLKRPEAIKTKHLLEEAAPLQSSLPPGELEARTKNSPVEHTRHGSQSFTSRYATNADAWQRLVSPENADRTPHSARGYNAERYSSPGLERPSPKRHTPPNQRSKGHNRQGSEIPKGGHSRQGSRMSDASTRRRSRGGSLPNIAFGFSETRSAEQAGMQTPMPEPADNISPMAH